VDVAVVERAAHVAQLGVAERADQGGAEHRVAVQVGIGLHPAVEAALVLAQDRRPVLVALLVVLIGRFQRRDRVAEVLLLDQIELAVQGSDRPALQRVSHDQVGLDPASRQGPEGPVHVGPVGKQVVAYVAHAQPGELLLDDVVAAVGRLAGGQVHVHPDRVDETVGGPGGCGVGLRGRGCAAACCGDGESGCGNAARGGTEHTCCIGSPGHILSGITLQLDDWLLAGLGA
jgi:hypothetical protein